MHMYSACKNSHLVINVLNEKIIFLYDDKSAETKIGEES